jgi:two-component system, OmpR family, sensor kinase
MFKPTIIPRVKLLGALSYFLLICVTIFILIISIFYDKRTIAVKSMNLYKYMQTHTKQELEHYLNQEDLERYSGDIEIAKKAENVLRDPLMQEAFYAGNIVLLEYDAHFYIQIILDDRVALFKEKSNVPSYRIYILSFLAFLALVLFVLHRFIYQAILPLKRLDLEIRRFAKGETNIDTRMKGDDEVANLGNAFDDAINTIKVLQEARELFFRNIMHEFKTPLTRAGLITHMVSDDFKHKKSLLQQFLLMQHHLDAMHQCEQLSSKLINLHVKEHLFIDLIEDVVDQLGLDPEDIVYHLEEKVIRVDYDFFIVVLKNLIDNAYKYSSNKKVYLRYKRSGITIANQCPKPKYDFNELLTPFTREEKNPISGMGLGLYISSEIIKKHEMKMNQKYLCGMFVVRVK